MVALTLTGQQVPQHSAIEVTLQLWLQQTFGGSQRFGGKLARLVTAPLKCPFRIIHAYYCFYRTKVIRFQTF